MKPQISYLRWPLLLLAALLVGACASMGRPQGGPRDEDPPVFVKSRPAPQALNVTSDRIIIEFDENIQLDDPLNKVVISPAQTTPAKVSAVGHRVTVLLQDSLRPNTTYTLDFTDAIKDLNEGNRLDGFAFAFSTGPEIDTLQISGMVLQAQNLEPAQGMLVGVHSNLSDSAITTLPFDRITRTNELGQFTIRNLKPGQYHIFAVNDINRDNRWDRSEDIAFFPIVIEPSASRIEALDTLRTADGSADSIVPVQVTAFAPNDILLTWFNEDYKPLYMSKYERRDRNRLYFEMGAPADSLPRLRFVGGPHHGQDLAYHSVLQASARRDTLTYWLTDTAIIASDSLHIAATYLKADSTDRNVWVTDTLNFTIRPQKKKQEKKKTLPADTLPPKPEIPQLKLRSTISSTAEVYQKSIIEADEPILTFTPEGINLEIMEQHDTVWTPVTPPEYAVADPFRPSEIVAEYRWSPGAKYRLTIDSMAVEGIYGHTNGPFKAEFKVKSLDEYGSVQFKITNLPPSAQSFVQLLNSQDDPVRTLPVAPDGAVTFANLTPGTFFARLIADSDSDLKWTTGSVSRSLTPEDVYYFPKKINLKKNWTLNFNWDLTDTPVDMQKPMDIKKNKPKSKGPLTPESDEEDDQYYDEFGNPSVDPDDPFGKRKNRNYNRNTNPAGAMRGAAMGTMQGIR